MEQQDSSPPNRDAGTDHEPAPGFMSVEREWLPQDGYGLPVVMVPPVLYSLGNPTTRGTDPELKERAAGGAEGTEIMTSNPEHEDEDHPPSIYEDVEPAPNCGLYVSFLPETGQTIQLNSESEWVIGHE